MQKTHPEPDKCLASVFTVPTEGSLQILWKARRQAAACLHPTGRRYGVGGALVALRRRCNRPMGDVTHRRCRWCSKSISGALA